MSTNNKPNDVRVSPELLPCPYCGGAARYVAADYVDNNGQPWPFAECDACSTGAPVEFWNKRAQPADQQGEPVAWIKPGVAETLTKNECCYAFGSQNPKGTLIPLYRHAPLQAENNRLKSAAETLTRMGYTDNGGELWKPPLGKKPDFNLIGQLKARCDELESALKDVSEWFDDGVGRSDEEWSLLVRVKSALSKPAGSDT